MVSEAVLVLPLLPGGGKNLLLLPDRKNLLLSVKEEV